jgi:hypothetical protein
MFGRHGAAPVVCFHPVNYHALAAAVNARAAPMVASPDRARNERVSLDIRKTALRDVVPGADRYPVARSRSTLLP